MKARGTGEVEARDSVSTGRIRELTCEEVGAVAGGVLPVVVIAVVVVAVAAQKLGEESEQNEEEGDGGDD